MPAVVTGSRGFVGSVLMAHLPGARTMSLAGEDWRAQLDHADLRGATVFHLGARVHQPRSSEDSGHEEDNAHKTEALALAAARGGAAAFVFVSSVKVNGEETVSAPFRADDKPHPEDGYGRSKWAAEQALARVAAQSGLPVTVVRPPLVYGRGARANLLALMRLCDSPWPLPFASIANRRSFIEVNDLARLLLAAPHARRGELATYMAAHPEPFSTEQLVRAVREALGRLPRLFACPAALIEAGATLVGRRTAARRLTRSLEVDARATESAIAWQAQIPFEQAVADMVHGYREAVGR